LTEDLIQRVPIGYVLDFGLEVMDPSEKFSPNEIELRPLNCQGDSNISFTSTCGIPFNHSLPVGTELEVSGIWLNPFLNYTAQRRLFPIAREVNWETTPLDSPYTEGERDMLIVFAALYGLSALISVASCLLLIRLIGASLSNIFLFFFVFSTFVFRCIFLALYSSGALLTATPGYFVLVETPSFFIVSILTVLIMSYSFCVMSVKGYADDKAYVRYWGYWFATQIMLYLILALILGLLTGLNTSETLQTSCSNRISKVVPNTTVDDIRIAYHAFILVIAFCCAVIVFYFGKALRDTLESNSLLTLSAIGGVSVVLTSLLWVIYSGLDGSSPYFVIPLFLTEVPPLLLICFLIFPSKEKEDEDEYRTRRRENRRRRNN
jgi:hypothetical protein